MQRVFRLFVFAAFLLPSFGQTVLHTKTRNIETDASQAVAEVSSPNGAAPGHLVLQFRERPTAATVEALRRRGIKVLGDVPENGLLVSLERPTRIRSLGAHYAAPIHPNDKISPLVRQASTDSNGYFLVEFHPDADMDRARATLLNLGAVPIDNPDLHPLQLMIHPSADEARATLGALSKLDEVAYIFPASQELANGVPVRACAGALTVNGPAAQAIPVFGDGWDGPGQGAASVTYVFSKMTTQLAATNVQTEIERAMSEWTRVVKVTWNPGVNAVGLKTVNVLFASGSHGDGFPFDGRGGVLAHTFYPSPPNPEPIAGDMHFDDAEPWHIGANTDVFSVALHELGHALGLGHSDDPTAVMYPYYKMATTLADPDKIAILTLYAAQDSTTPPPPPPPPLTLSINMPPSMTTAPSINLTGTASGGTGAITVGWSSSGGASGTAAGSGSDWSISNIPLAMGSNTITVTAVEGASQVSKSVTVTRLAPPPPVPPGGGGAGLDTTPPTLAITTPSTATSLAATATIVIRGTSADNVAVKQISWATNFGTAGIASGTTSWSATVPLLIGNNTITVRATDSSGNVAWRTVLVMRK